MIIIIELYNRLQDKLKYEMNFNTRQDKTTQDKVSKCEFPTCNLITTRTPPERKRKRTRRKLLKAGYGFEVR